MTLTINGTPKTTDADTLPALLAELELADKPLVVEHNRSAVLPADQATLKLADGDELELILITAGG